MYFGPKSTLIFYFGLTGIRVSVPQNILPAGCPISEGLIRGRGAGNLPQRGMMRRPVPSRGGQLEIAGVVVGQWGPNYGSMPPGRLPQPIQSHARGRLPPQVGYRMCNRSLTMVRYRCIYMGQDPQESGPMTGAEKDVENVR